MMFVTIASLFVVSAMAQSPMDFYTGCGDTKQCWGSPEGCIDDQSCAVASSYVKNENDTSFYDFETLATYDGVDDGRSWVAVGFSRDARMRDDTVLFCSEPTGAELYWNVPNFAVAVGDNTGVTLNSLLSVEGSLYCHVTRDAQLIFIRPSPVGEEINDLDAEPFFWMIASGPLMDDEDTANQHTVKEVSAEAVDFSA